jgi:hypothetical protein
MVFFCFLPLHLLSFSSDLVFCLCTLRISPLVVSNLYTSIPDTSTSPLLPYIYFSVSSFILLRAITPTPLLIPTFFSYLLKVRLLSTLHNFLLSFAFSSTRYCLSRFILMFLSVSFLFFPTTMVLRHYCCPFFILLSFDNTWPEN